MEFDPTRKLTMAKRRTVLGHALSRGTPLEIVDKPEKAGEVDHAMARMLWLKGVAIYSDDFRPTPVETPDAEAARLARDAQNVSAAGPRGAEIGELSPAEPGDDLELEIPDDLVVWQRDDAEAGKRAGDRVTNDDLRLIATREQVEIESDDNKADLQRKITLRRLAVPIDRSAAPGTPDAPPSSQEA